MRTKTRWLSIFLIFCTPLLHADQTRDLQKALQQRLSKQVFIVRNFYGGDHLSFDSQGNLVKGDKKVGYKGCWCAAQLQIEKVEVKNDKLILRGPRIRGSYDSKTKSFSKLFLEGSTVQFDIELSATQMNEDAIVGILEQIFLTRKDDLDRLIPDSWRAADYNPAGEVARVKKDAASPEQNVTAPKPVHTPDPEYSEEARSRGLQGSLILWIVVDEKGDVSRIKLDRCLGMGLDERAIQSVSRWKFEPAIRNGQPIAVQLNVEVTFRLYR